MTCRDVAGFLSEYIAGELSAAVVSEFEGHIAGCPNCHLYLTQYRHTILVSQSACQDDAVSLTGEIPEELVQAILSSVAKA